VNSEERASGALTGWRVLEIADGLAASFCGKVLSDLGADVVKVEPPEGHASRRWAPRRADAAPDEPGGRFLYLNRGKSSVIVPERPGDDEVLQRLVAACDVLVTDDATWYDRRATGALDEATTVAVVSPFGVTGPYAGYRAHHLVSFHAGGEGSILPSGPGWQRFPERAPIQVGADLAEYDAGWNAAVAVLAAMYDRLRTGRGQGIDVSIQESELTLNRTRLSRFNNDGVVLRREGSRYGFMGMMQCRDGWVQLVGVTPVQWDALAASPDAGALADPRIATAAARADHMELAAEALQAWCEQRDKAEVVRILSPLGCPVGAYARPPDLMASEQLAHRNFFRTVDDGRGKRIDVPGPPYRFSATPAAIEPAPALGRATMFEGARADKPRLPHGRGLEGVRILDFTWAAAGPYATCLLALLGADVVKVESTKRPDPARRGFLADYGGTNRSPNFNELNLNKRSFQVDLSEPAGLALAHRLARWADVVIDNFRPGVMARFRLDAERLLAERPELIVASSSANGATGPDATAAGLASIFGATGGLSEQTGYPDGPPTEIGESTDYRSGAALAVAVLAALLHRARTGEGQHVDLASREVVVASAPDALLAEALGVPWPIRVGNGHRELAPHDVYRAAGDDEWVAVAVGDECEWAALCTVLGQADWAERYPDAATRRVAGAEIDAAIAAWTRPRSSRAAFEALQAAGVPAMAVMTNESLATDPHLAARKVFADIEHPEIGRTRVMRQPWLFSDFDIAIRHGPLMGQDNDHVLDTILGLSTSERADLEDVLR
jgi:crotonobetainyl-CoA:carnitine CoA-transferase CaiB-like acyl-CoA transferase